ncbi:MAG: tRNA (adenosine(37)-N6)-threonylcarbamoyltransferase complex dimerization subunit type 1 TsaB [Anaerolineales bacterium]|nr:tRNA (adenosine(37)-N6)-threonylcarbamoyltransferase complex dimerization subunit type 1 TsaB [Anaerolineales bacterium]
MLLAIDTSTRTVGLALYDGVQVRCELVWKSQDFHTVELAPAISETLRRAAAEINLLQVIAVAIGPGSFTGLRIGLAMAKGLALARHLPLIGIPTLDAVAASQPVRNLPLAAVLNAGRGRLAAGWYHGESGQWQPTRPVEMLDVNKLSWRIQQPTIVCGELNEEEQRILARKHKNVLLASPAHALRRPSFLAELAWKRWQAGQVDEPAALAPIYLHVGDPIPG